MSVGKEIRMARLLNEKSGRLLAITMDHPITRGVLPGLENIREVMRLVCAGKPDAITIQKGIARNWFQPYAGKVALIMKSTSYSIPYHPYYDTPVADVEEAVTLGADAISVGMIVGGPEQAAQLTQLGKISKEADRAGMPLVAHIYPKGSMIKDSSDADRIAYAVRAGAELGVDIIKTIWSGSAESFQRVIESCPAKVCLAGGAAGNELVDYLKMTREALDIGLAGVTFGRSVWGDAYPTAVVLALKALIHDDMSVEDALAVYQANAK
ncbi:MAG TPA: fructose-bisphosphate aldolase [Sphaerochaeta sp.]|nr:fructose-bisphosphate aldolase [Sphaerochaeta sp.]